MKQVERILIIGNSGSGKTWLGKALSQSRQIPLFHMDTIRWDQGGYEIRRSVTDIERDLEAIQNQEEWILEGVFGKMAQECLPFATLLIWLDIPWEDCKQNLLLRGPQFDNALNSHEKEAALAKLIEWASTHHSRNDANSWSFFNDLYSDFKNEKICLRNRDEIQVFLMGDWV